MNIMFIPREDLHSLKKGSQSLKYWKEQKVLRTYKKAELGIERGMLQRLRFRTYPKDPATARWVSMLRNKGHILEPGAGARLASIRGNLMQRVKSSKSEPARKRAAEALEHIERDMAMYAVWTEVNNENFRDNTDEELESRIHAYQDELRGMRR
jgi:hypothetical protein